MADKNKNNFNVKTFFITSIVTSMSLVVGLFWKDAISILLDSIVPDKYDVYSSVAAAIIATVIIGIAIFMLYQSENTVNKYGKHVKTAVKKHKKYIENKRKRYEKILHGSNI